MASYTVIARIPEVAAIDSPAPQNEGTIRFAYSLETPTEPVADAATLCALQAWRTICRRLGLVGQDPDRYQGFGFGNLSARHPQHPDEVIITASQTSGEPLLEDRHLVRITHCNPARFWIDAMGHQPPSSEALTHAMLYQADAAIDWVFHGHSPEIWQRAEDLALPATPADVPYGSPAMVEAVAELLQRESRRPLAFVTLGHEDGVFACGATPAETGGELVRLLARALS